MAERLRMAAAVVGGLVMAYLKQYTVLYILVAAAVLFDFVTGMGAAVVSGQGLSSKLARRGFLKKMMLLVSVAFGTFLDALMPFCVRKTGMDMQDTLIFSTVICLYICISECISIAENICRCTDRALPGWLVRLLKETKDKLEKEK